MGSPSRIQVALLLSCLLHLTLQATIQHQKDAVARYQEFLQGIGKTEEEFRQAVTQDPQMKNKAMDFLKTIKPTKKFSASKPSDLHLMRDNSPLVDYGTPQIIIYYGYHVETHYITTKDGYNLEMHRIPYGKNGAQPHENREPIILQHGLLSSSADWVMNPPDQSFAFLLADAGYDVWLPNIRGNTYSKTHTQLSNEDKRYWMFSWEQMGVYDVPCIIDYVLLRTGFSQVYYAGHSMGTTMFFVMMDKYPEYNEKIRAFFALAPVVTVDNMLSPLKDITPLTDTVDWLFESLGLYEFLPSNQMMDYLATNFCEDDDFSQLLCTNVLFILCGYNEDQLNTTMLPIYLSHLPAGASTKTVVHYGQIANSAIFRRFDHGEDNMYWYGSTVPPPYDLKKTTVDTYFYWGENDWLASPDDVKEAAGYLPNLKLSHRVDDHQWTHLDFVWGIEAHAKVYQKILKELSDMQLEIKP